jgi:hypothetical protein
LQALEYAVGCARGIGPVIMIPDEDGETEDQVVRRAFRKRQAPTSVIIRSCWPEAKRELEYGARSGRARGYRS